MGDLVKPQTPPHHLYVIGIERKGAIRKIVTD
jgi:hypothetical protein